MVPHNAPPNQLQLELLVRPLGRSIQPPVQVTPAHWQVAELLVSFYRQLWALSHVAWLAVQSAFRYSHSLRKSSTAWLFLIFYASFSSYLEHLKFELQLQFLC